MTEQIVLRGGKPITGKVQIHVAKNALLPILAAVLLCQSPVTLPQMPALTDSEVMLEILAYLGCKITPKGQGVIIDPREAQNKPLPARFTGKLRASVLFLGALLGRFGHASLAACGGCCIGKRGIDLHLDLLKGLGTAIAATPCAQGQLEADVSPNPPTNITLRLPFASVGATENLLLAAVCRPGRVLLQNAAKEPEVADLANFLNACGGCIIQRGNDYEILGVTGLKGCVYTPIPDRIEAGTFLVAGAMMGGPLTLCGVCLEDLAQPIALLRQAGCEIQASGRNITIRRSGRLKGLGHLTTAPYPGFPTDLQPAFVTLAALAEGETQITERLFENRFGHVQALNAMGANICVADDTAVIKGVPKLQGARVKATDLRAAGALVLAGLFAQGETIITGADFLRRGYADLIEQLQQCGGSLAWQKEAFAVGS